MTAKAIQLTDKQREACKRFELTDEQREALERITGGPVASNESINVWLMSTPASKGEVVMLIDWMERLTKRVELLTAMVEAAEISEPSTKTAKQSDPSVAKG